jgi:hypothetical protein
VLPRATKRRQLVRRPASLATGSYGRDILDIAGYRFVGYRRALIRTVAGPPAVGQFPLGVADKMLDARRADHDARDQNLTGSPPERDGEGLDIFQGVVCSDDGSRYDKYSGRKQESQGKLLPQGEIRLNEQGQRNGNDPEIGPASEVSRDRRRLAWVRARLASLHDIQDCDYDVVAPSKSAVFCAVRQQGRRETRRDRVLPPGNGLICHARCVG